MQLVFDLTEVPVRLFHDQEVIKPGIDRSALFNRALEYLRAAPDQNIFATCSKLSYGLIYQSNFLPKTTTENDRLRLYGLLVASLLEYIPWIVDMGFRPDQCTGFALEKEKSIALKIEETK